VRAISLKKKKRKREKEKEEIARRTPSARAHSRVRIASAPAFTLLRDNPYFPARHFSDGAQRIHSTRLSGIMYTRKGNIWDALDDGIPFSTRPRRRKARRKWRDQVLSQGDKEGKIDSRPVVALALERRGTLRSRRMTARCATVSEKGVAPEWTPRQFPKYNR